MINFKKPTQPTTNKHKTNRGKKAPPLPPPSSIGERENEILSNYSILKHVNKYLFIFINCVFLDKTKQNFLLNEFSHHLFTESSFCTVEGSVPLALITTICNY